MVFKYFFVNYFLRLQIFLGAMPRYYHAPWIRGLSEGQLQKTAGTIVESLVNEIDKDEVRTRRETKQRIYT